MFKSHVLRSLGWRIGCRELLTPGCGVERLQRSSTVPGPPERRDPICLGGAADGELTTHQAIV